MSLHVGSGMPLRLIGYHSNEIFAKPQFKEGVPIQAAPIWRHVYVRLHSTEIDNKPQSGLWIIDYCRIWIAQYVFGLKLIRISVRPDTKSFMQQTYRPYTKRFLCSRLENPPSISFKNDVIRSRLFELNLH